MSNLHRGYSIDASYQVSVHLAKRFQRRRFLKSANQKQELPVAAMFVDGSGQNEQSLERTFHRCFLPSFTSFGWGVSEEKIKMWKVNGRQMPSDGKSSHCLWQGELKITEKYWERNGLEKHSIMAWVRDKWFKILHSSNFLVPIDNLKNFLFKQWIFKSTIFSLLPMHSSYSKFQWPNVLFQPFTLKSNFGVRTSESISFANFYSFLNFTCLTHRTKPNIRNPQKMEKNHHWII